MNGPTNGIAGQTRSERCRVADTNQPHPYNPAVPFSLDPVEAVRVNLSAAERRTASLAGRRTVKKQWQAAWLVRALQCIDLTTLNGDDTEGRVRRLCAKARHPLRADLQEALGLADRAITTGADEMSRQTGVPFFIADAMQGICLIAVLVAMTLSRYQIRFRTSPERRATP